jgi:anhydro-N-acetylmuramic acid kinase
MKPLTVLGIMSGTSLDGVDFAWCRVGSGGVRLIELKHVAFPARLRVRLMMAAEDRASSYEVAQLHHDLGRFYAQRAMTASALKADLCGLHGQTIFHRPHSRQPATFQLGEPYYLAEALNIPVIHNFRTGDMVLGGQGAPLATLFHREMFARKKRHICVHNLGGISNVTSLDWRQGVEPETRSFDTGPGNLLLDLAARHYSGGRLRMDRDGRMAKGGRVNETLLQSWLGHPYFRRKPPKSTGRELFGETCFKRYLTRMKRARLSPRDALATLTAFTARSMAMQYRDYLPGQLDVLILAGGGAANPTLVRYIGEVMGQFYVDQKPEILTSAQLGWPWQGVEPAAFAWLAWKRWYQQPGHIPDTTGARQSGWLGQVTQLG